MTFLPKKENENVGFHYEVSEEQLAARSKMTVAEIIEWVESTAKFIYSVQNPEERARMKKAKIFKW